MQNASNLMDSLDPARILALKLHALHEADRNWILSRLEPDAHLLLSPLLKELSELGLKLENTDIQSMEYSLASNEIEDITPKLSDELTLINDASVSQLEMIFSDEPKLIFEHFCAIKSWAWKREVDIHQSVGKIRKVPGRQSSITEPTATVKMALVKIVADQMLELKRLTTWEPTGFDSHQKPASRIPMIRKFINKILP